MSNNTDYNYTVFDEDSNEMCSYGCGGVAKYHHRNGKWLCKPHHMKCPTKRKMMNDRMSFRREAIDKESGLTLLQLDNKLRVDKMRVEGTLVSRAATARKTMSKIDPVSGLSKYQENGAKSAKTKVENGTNAKMGKKLSAFRLTVDPITCETWAKTNAKKATATRKKIDPNTGLNIDQTSGIKSKKTKDEKIDPITGLNVHQLTSIKAMQTMREEGTLAKRSEKIQEALATVNPVTGMTPYELGQLRARKLRNYKDLDLLYQGTHELSFLETIEKEFSLQYIIDNIVRGPRFKYTGTNDKSRTYYSDFLDKNTNTIYEIKSSWWWDSADRKDLDQKENNKRKLLSAESSGYNVVLVLDKKFISDWKSL